MRVQSNLHEICFGFALLYAFIGWQILCHFLNQWEAKAKTNSDLFSCTVFSHPIRFKFWLVCCTVCICCGWSACYYFILVLEPFSMSVESNFTFALVLLYLTVIGWQSSHHFLNQWEAKPKPIVLGCMHIPMLDASYMHLLWVLISWLCCLHLLWLAREITLVLVLQCDTQLKTSLFLLLHCYCCSRLKTLCWTISSPFMEPLMQLLHRYANLILVTLILY